MRQKRSYGQNVMKTVMYTPFCVTYSTTLQEHLYFLRSTCKKSRINKHILLMQTGPKTPYFGTMLHHERGVRVKKKGVEVGKRPVTTVNRAVNNLSWSKTCHHDHKCRHDLSVCTYGAHHAGVQTLSGGARIVAQGSR
jgi:hypothetical protein